MKTAPTKPACDEHLDYLKLAYTRDNYRSVAKIAAGKQWDHIHNNHHYFRYHHHNHYDNKHNDDNNSITTGYYHSSWIHRCWNKFRLAPV